MLYSLRSRYGGQLLQAIDTTSVGAEGSIGWRTSKRSVAVPSCSRNDGFGATVGAVVVWASSTVVACRTSASTGSAASGGGTRSSSVCKCSSGRRSGCWFIYLSFRGAGGRVSDRRRSPQCRTARWESVQFDRPTALRKLLRLRSASRPELNFSDTVIGLCKQHGGCTTLQHHRRRGSALRRWSSNQRVAFGDQCRADAYSGLMRTLVGIPAGISMIDHRPTGMKFIHTWAAHANVATHRSEAHSLRCCVPDVGTK